MEDSIFENIKELRLLIVIQRTSGTNYYINNLNEAIIWDNYITSRLCEFFFCRVLLNYLRTSTFIEPKSVQDRTELLLEAEYYQIMSLIKQLKNEPATSVIVVEKLFFWS
jgi:hypothetical protein